MPGFLYNLKHKVDVSGLSEDTQTGIAFAMRPNGNSLYTGSRLWLDMIGNDEVSTGLRVDAESFSVDADIKISGERSVVYEPELSVGLPGTMGTWLVDVGEVSGDAVEISATSFA